jgi:hypothetical protein
VPTSHFLKPPQVKLASNSPTRSNDYDGTMGDANAFVELGLSVIGLGTQYPPHDITPDLLAELSKRFYADTAS